MAASTSISRILWNDRIFLVLRSVHNAHSVFFTIVFFSSRAVILCIVRCVRAINAFTRFMSKADYSRFDFNFYSIT